jgi:hypothetical protein
VFGADHDKDSSHDPTPFDGAYGRWDNPPTQDPQLWAGLRTIMAYYHGVCHGDCAQILHYSNVGIDVPFPEKEYPFHTGVHIPTEHSENADVIAEFADETAQYRQRVDLIFANGFENSP